MSATAAPEPVLTRETLAAKRGWQTLLQGLAVDVTVAVALVVLAYLPALDSWDTARLQVGIISFAVAKSIVQAIVSWVIRRWFDRSGWATPMPDAEAAQRAM